MKISIIIATYNVAKDLPACLDSCLRQTWHDKEIIVIDGGSTDGTLEVIRSYAPRLGYWTSERDKGIYDAWNKALPHVTGSWVLFRGADDLFWDDSVLEKAVPALESAAPEELICYGAVVHVNERQDLVGIRAAAWERAKPQFFKKMTIPHPGTFHHVRLFRRFGGFDPSYRVAGDYDFLLRAIRGGADAKFLPGLIVTRISAGGISNTNIWLTKRESVRALRENGATGIPFAQLMDLTIFFCRALTRKASRLLLGSEWYSRTQETKLRRRSRIVQGRARSALQQGDLAS